MNTNQIIIIILIPIISALIGWFTNFIAIKSLFKPYKPVNILGLKFQGLIPKRQKILSKKISKIIIQYLISNEDLIFNLNDKEQLEKIKNKLSPILLEKIISEVPIMFKSMAEPLIKNIIDKKSIEIIKEFISHSNNYIFENIDLEQIMTKKLEEYNPSNFENILNKIAKEELKHIEYLGALIGFIVGLFQVLIFLFLQ